MLTSLMRTRALPSRAPFISSRVRRKAVGGHVLAHMSDTRVTLRKGKGDQRICKIEQHPSQPPAEAVFQIANGGVDVAAD